MIVFGIDGGGTKTHLKVEKDNKIIKEVFGESINIHSNTIDKALDNLNKLFEKANIEHFDAGCMGIAGVRTSDEKNIFKDFIKNKFPKTNIRIENDALITLVREDSCIRGSSIISGTGSIAVAIIDNKVITLGGYGHIIGDEGSAYAICLDSIKEMVKIEEKRSKYNDSLIYKNLLDFYKIKSTRDILSILKESSYKSKIAKAAPIITKLAIENDTLAISILDKASNDIISLIDSLLSKNKILQNQEISLRGGVLLNDVIVRTKVINFLKANYPNLIFDNSNMSAADCALLLAKKSK